MNVAGFVPVGILVGAALALAAGDHKKTEMGDMVLVEGGTFEMGDVLDEGVRWATPVHNVTVSSFYLNMYEVTVEEFTIFVKQTSYLTAAETESAEEAASANDDYSGKLASLGAFVLDPAKDPSWVTDANWRNPQYEQSPYDPVACVSWTDAISYCNWLSETENLPVAYDVKTGDLLDGRGQRTDVVSQVRGYRLPTEAEWEFAARERGKKVRFGNGRSFARLKEMNFNAAGGDFAFAEKGQPRIGTVPVGSFSPNSLGLFDMSGNVWEWCSDFVGRYSKQPQTNPYQQEGLMGPRRAARGGPFAGDASFARVSARLGWVANDRCNNIGFRVARSK